ncbi:MAG TPA: hypothetical protein VFC51_19750 [Chloroflexota bacterium]|nr:hypothetical protein [Chloroflexota bacterium]
MRSIVPKLLALAAGALVLGFIGPATALIHADAAQDPIVGTWLAVGPAGYGAIFTFDAVLDSGGQVHRTVTMSETSGRDWVTTGEWKVTGTNQYDIWTRTLRSNESGTPGVVRRYMRIHFNPSTTSWVTTSSLGSTDYRVEYLSYSAGVLNTDSTEIGPQLLAIPVPPPDQYARPSAPAGAFPAFP